MKVSLEDAERIADLMIKSRGISEVINKTYGGPILELHLAYRAAISEEIREINQRYLKV